MLIIIIQFSIFLLVRGIIYSNNLTLFYDKLRSNRKFWRHTETLTSNRKCWRQTETLTSNRKCWRQTETLTSNRKCWRQTETMLCKTHWGEQTLTFCKTILFSEILNNIHVFLIQIIVESCIGCRFCFRFCCKKTRKWRIKFHYCIWHKIRLKKCHYFNSPVIYSKFNNPTNEAISCCYWDVIVNITPSQYENIVIP